MLDGYDYENLTFDDGRGAYPEDIRSRAPLGTRARLQRKAREEGISNGEVIRRAVMSYLTGGKDRDGYSGPNAPSAA